ncbi:hypothetical protein QQP08_025034 [Theobroma cacao]|nr:hypothetical protein QQP08_025034 [Theobroma cacao]
MWSGVDMLMKAVGKDCTALFSILYFFFWKLFVILSLTCLLDKYHAWVNAECLLEKCLVGTLDDSEGSNR